MSDTTRWALLDCGSTENDGPAIDRFALREAIVAAVRVVAGRDVLGVRGDWGVQLLAWEAAGRLGHRRYLRFIVDGDLAPSIPGALRMNVSLDVGGPSPPGGRLDSKPWVRIVAGTPSASSQASDEVRSVALRATGGAAASEPSHDIRFEALIASELYPPSDEPPTERGGSGGGSDPSPSRDPLGGDEGAFEAIDHGHRAPTREVLIRTAEYWAARGGPSARSDASSSPSPAGGRRTAEEIAAVFEEWYPHPVRAVIAYDGALTTNPAPSRRGFILVGNANASYAHAREGTIDVSFYAVDAFETRARSGDLFFWAIAQRGEILHDEVGTVTELVRALRERGVDANRIDAQRAEAVTAAWLLAARDIDAVEPRAIAKVMRWAARTLAYADAAEFSLPLDESSLTGWMGPRWTAFSGADERTATAHLRDFPRWTHRFGAPPRWRGRDLDALAAEVSGRVAYSLEILRGHRRHSDTKRRERRSGVLLFWDLSETQ